MDYLSSNVICPFYFNSDNKSIRCEGIFSVYCLNIFKGREAVKAYAKKYCCDKYKRCPLAVILYKKYD